VTRKPGLDATLSLTGILRELLHIAHGYNTNAPCIARFRGQTGEWERLHRLRPNGVRTRFDRRYTTLRIYPNAEYSSRSVRGRLLIASALSRRSPRSAEFHTRHLPDHTGRLARVLHPWR